MKTEIWNINYGLLNRLTAIKERQLNEMSKVQFHLYKLQELGFKKSVIHIKKQLKNNYKYEN
jgi:hypothetical protein